METRHFHSPAGHRAREIRNVPVAASLLHQVRVEAVRMDAGAAGVPVALRQVQIAFAGQQQRRLQDLS